jgi:SSS family solute:Na+ symporter
MGGMRAVVISDVVQMLLLLTAVALALHELLPYLPAHAAELSERTRPLLHDWGLGGYSDFGFWPMLFGGLFLYVAYYGFDQSQAQRLLAAHDENALGRVLLLNGILRFPIVLAYCVLGLGLAAYALEHPAFLDALPRTETGAPNINLVFPSFVLSDFPAGLAGLAIVGLFAAAMSSIDSALNSLSASTLEDFLPDRSGAASPRGRFLLSKLVTLAWGLFAIAFSFSVEFIADTILEAINKVGSLVNGPLLGVFLIALLGRRRSQTRALLAFSLGLLLNVLTWLLLPQVSWLWWNVSGSAATLGVYVLLGLVAPGAPAVAEGGLTLTLARPLTTPLIAMAALILGLLVALQIGLR